MEERPAGFAVHDDVGNALTARRDRHPVKPAKSSENNCEFESCYFLRIKR